jgi:hypothetical protein
MCDENYDRRVETRVMALLYSLDDIPLGKVRLCDIHKLANSLELRRACGLDGISNECVRHHPRWLLVHLAHLCNQCLLLFHFPKLWKETKFITLSKPGKGPKFPQSSSTIILLSTTGNIFEKVILKIVQRHIGKRGLLNASHFGFRARQRTTLQCMRLTNNVTLNFTSYTSTAAIFLDIEKDFDTTRHLSLPYKLSELKFSISLIKLISAFISQRKFRVSAEGEMSTPRIFSKAATWFLPVLNIVQYI